LKGLKFTIASVAWLSCSATPSISNLLRIMDQEKSLSWCKIFVVLSYWISWTMTCFLILVGYNGDQQRKKMQVLAWTWRRFMTNLVFGYQVKPNVSVIAVKRGIRGTIFRIPFNIGRRIWNTGMPLKLIEPNYGSKAFCTR
jgi:hypothetical protein